MFFYKMIPYLSLLEKMLTAFFKISLSSLISFSSFSKAFIFNTDSVVSEQDKPDFSLEYCFRHLLIEAKLTLYSSDNSETVFPESYFSP